MKPGRLKRALQKLMRKTEDYQETLTFSQSNHPELAAGGPGTALHDNAPHDDPQPSKLLVVGNESVFSEDIMTYSMDMAARMSYSIVALNAAPLSCDTFKRFSASRNKICCDFNKISEEQAEAFRQRAQARGIGFEHVVKFEDTDAAVEEVLATNGPIDFVVSGRRAAAETRVVNDQRPRSEIYVYSMNTG